MPKSYYKPKKLTNRGALDRLNGWLKDWEKEVNLKEINNWLPVRKLIVNEILAERKSQGEIKP